MNVTREVVSGYPTTPEMIEELEMRGFRVFHEGFNHLGEYPSEELVQELKDRGHYYRDMDDDSLMIEVESRGYYLSPEDTERGLLWDIYRHAKWMSPEQLRDYLNDLFIKHLEKWL